MPKRKKHTLMTNDKFEFIKKFYSKKSKKDLMDFTGLSKPSIYNAIHKMEENPDSSFEELYKTAGRKKKSKKVLHSKIRSIIGSDNSLTQVGCMEKLGIKLSKAQLCREFKGAGLSRKRLKKKV